MKTEFKEYEVFLKYFGKLLFLIEVVAFIGIMLNLFLFFGIYLQMLFTKTQVNVHLMQFIVAICLATTVIVTRIIRSIFWENVNLSTGPYIACVYMSAPCLLFGYLHILIAGLIFLVIALLNGIYAIKHTLSKL